MRNSSWMDAYDSSDELYSNLLDTMESGVLRPQMLLRNAFLNIPGDSWKDKLAKCASCKCCTRHQTNRPSKLEPWIETDPDTFSVKLHHVGPECKCNCRHMARFICRQVDDNM